MTITSNRTSGRKSSYAKPIIHHVTDQTCPVRGDVFLLHVLESVEVGEPGESRVETNCKHCGLSWAELDAIANPKAKGRVVLDKESRDVL